MLILSRKYGQRIRIGTDIIVTVLESKGDSVKIGIHAPESVQVHRQEVYEAIQTENLSAAKSDLRNLHIPDNLIKP